MTDGTSDPRPDVVPPADVPAPAADPPAAEAPATPLPPDDPPAAAASAPPASEPAAAPGFFGRLKGRVAGLYRRTLARPLSPVIEVFNEFIEDDAFTLAAGLAYYTALSFAPLVILLLALASYMGPQMQDQLRLKLTDTLDEKAASMIDTVLEASKEPDVRSVAGLVSLGVLLFSASGVFAQLQSALNRIWDVKAKPGVGIKGWIRKRLLSFGMVLALAFVLLVSVAATAIITGMFGDGKRAPGWVGMLLQTLNTIVSIGVFTLLFGLIFKYLPDVRIAWRDVWVGAAITAVLFSGGKYLLGAYLGESAVGSSYGAAGSLIALLVWVYYSALILFLGAEVTEVYARRTGSSIEPDAYAVRIGKKGV